MEIWLALNRCPPKHGSLLLLDIYICSSLMLWDVSRKSQWCLVAFQDLSKRGKEKLVKIPTSPSSCNGFIKGRERKCPLPLGNLGGRNRNGTIFHSGRWLSLLNRNSDCEQGGKKRCLIQATNPFFLRRVHTMDGPPPIPPPHPHPYPDMITNGMVHL